MIHVHKRLIGMGIITLMVIFTSMLLCIISVFSFQDAQQSKELTNKYETAVVSQYEAQRNAYEIQGLLKAADTKEEVDQTLQIYAVFYDTSTNDYHFAVNVDARSALLVQLDKDMNIISWKIKKR